MKNGPQHCSKAALFEGGRWGHVEKADYSAALVQLKHEEKMSLRVEVEEDGFHIKTRAGE